MKIPAKDRLVRLGPYIDRLSDLAWARYKGEVTEEEYDKVRTLIYWSMRGA